MPNTYVTNQQPTTYGGALSLLVEMLIGAGWTYKASGDGLAGYSSTGKIFTGTGSGALGWNNAKAWARIQDPSAIREFIFQHDAAGGSRIKYSPLAKFAGGSPSATITPSSTDERYLRGATSDATPSYGAAWFNAGITTGIVKFQGAALAASPYGFWFAGAVSPGGAPSTGLVMDPVTGAPEDIDPVVFHVGAAAAFKSGGLGSTGAVTTASFVVSGSVNQGCWGYMDIALTQFLYVAPGHFAFMGGQNGGSISTDFSYGVQGGGLVLNAFNTKQEAFPIPYARPTVASLAAPLGLKGWSSLMRWTTVARTNFSDTLDTKNWICVGNVWLPWDGTTTPTN